jgi:nucleoside phosphorylase
MSALGRKLDGIPQHAISLAQWARTRGAPGASGGSDRPTIGLITAIPEEFTAMRGLLEDPADEYVTGDPARYTLGMLPSPDAGPVHKVVLTMLGATATDAAADGCTHMIRSFPSIRVVIMVGIAAGIPNVSRPEQHVRLGDIVVATDGIVDYDHVNVGPDGVRQRQGFPTPSARLTRGVNILKSDELSGRRPWEQWLDTTSRPGLAGYARPNGRKDVLRDSLGYPIDHPRRDRSGHRKGFPKVHYGLIGSADRAISDVATRDQLAARHRLLAVEMEGAAIGASSSLNGREWFVVRGISDYGDSQRDGTWRKYASLVAAAYVRALLANCLPMGYEDDHRNRKQVQLR